MTGNEVPHGVGYFGEAAVLWLGHFVGKIHCDFRIVIDPGE